MTENTSKMGGGSYITVKLQDFLDPKPADKRTADDIIEGIRKKMQ